MQIKKFETEKKITYANQIRKSKYNDLFVEIILTIIQEGCYEYTIQKFVRIG